MARLILALVALTPSAVLALDGVALPAGFDGIYASEGMHCGTGERITIQGGTIFGEDWGMTVTDLIEFPGEPNKVEATLLVSSGGEDRIDSAVIQVDTDGQGPVLVLDFPDGNRTIWNRCE